MTSKKSLKRGAVKKSDSTFIGGWVPQQMLLKIDQAIQLHDLDRSKFIRAALREKLSRDLSPAA
jgi:metal-responsive CopG/Arc/MetJ family transcriptional regulator